MTILEILYSSGVCTAHGEALRLIRSGVISQGSKVFSSPEEVIRPAEVDPIMIGKHKLINRTHGFMKV
jgi:hypothetical protein